ncbi:transcription-repair coupling factor [Treponema parvum]|uniref:Transcription-repair-coupling factor n=1 Tax=Treponema parvum TaxID=138851 RepID=A0A975EZV0_9SPIR|nr:transcription-repair coupling factor [Treponema parvum]QTQ11828.1 transcription-repair coupling factor [Treponema parvum]
MNTLLSSYVFPQLEKWTCLKDAITRSQTDDQIFPVEIEGLHGAANTFFTAEYITEKQKKLLNGLQYTTTGRYSQGSALKGAQRFSMKSASLDTVIIVPNEKDVEDVCVDLSAAFVNAQIFKLPWWGSAAYRPTARGSIVFGERAGVLCKLSCPKPYTSISCTPRIFVASLRSFLTPVPPPEYIRSLLQHVRVKQEIDTISLSEKLTASGYIRVPKVTVHGEFTLRGEVLDIFLPGEENPYRILFDFDKIEKIKIFDAETQATVGSVEDLLIYPMKEVLWTDELVNILSEKLNDKKELKASLENDRETDSETGFEIDLPFTEEAKKAKEKLLEELYAYRESEGEELFYPVLWDKKYCITDYLSETSEVFFYDYDRLSNSQESIDREYMGMYRKARPNFPVLLPDQIMFKFSDAVCFHKKNIFYRTLLTPHSIDNDTFIRMECEPSQTYFGNINYLKEQIGAAQKDGWRIFIYTDNKNQLLRINEILKEFTKDAGDKGEVGKDKGKNSFSGEEIFPVVLIPHAVSEGFSIPEIKLKVIQENEIFGRRKHAPKSLHKAKSAAIDSFVELNPGDYIVHVNYGIGIFKGIERVRSFGNERDYIKIEYAGEEFAFVPIEQVNLVQRYIGNEGSPPKIDTIGSKNWENRKNRVKKAVEDLAQRLIDLYSRRKIAKGFPFPKDTEWQTAFEAAFPYEDTPDQITVTGEVKADMERPVPMDRLICGDVGYGKTEIAMRAAFKAVMGGKQVAFLAPTTILAEQHYETCMERFDNFPVKISHLSRFVAYSEQKRILEKLAKGEIDILIGTHRIIQKDIVFKNLGLMIIDEEQRFGVKDKERLKLLKNNVDSLSMSATPIPRTLHMSLLKIRDMSLLTTPPQNRQPIETVIAEYADENVAEAIRREVERGGQVFYLHNRVEDLADIKHKLEQLVPEMIIDTAHGQMPGETLDDIFRRFKMGGFHVLISTTIIENGIDIPNVNTIIIDRADMYGVSQLYQLRGRVGRSGRKAYAYLFYPQNKALSEIAMKRLQVISDFTELGSGFKIAMKDMEIRGAGNLLGQDQSGNVYSVGFDLYLRLLNEAVQRLTAQNYDEQPEVLMELEYTGFIPDSYVQNPQIKMEIYKKIASVQEKSELDNTYYELNDRFGPVPEEVNSLLSLAEIRIICKKLAISSIKEQRGVVQITLDQVSKISVDKVLNLINSSGGRVRLDPARPNIILLSTGKIGLKEKSEFLCEKLNQIV